MQMNLNEGKCFWRLTWWDVAYNVLDPKMESGVGKSVSFINTHFSQIFFKSSFRLSLDGWWVNLPYLLTESRLTDKL